MLLLPDLSTDRLKYYLQFCLATARRYDTNLFWVLWRAASLLMWKGFRRGEASLSGLFNPEVSFKAIRHQCLNQRDLSKHQKADNDGSPADLTEDKAVFYKKCMTEGIPTPDLYGVYDSGSGWSIDEPRIYDDAGWYRFFIESVPESFVIKPTRGVYGWGVKVLNRTTRQTFSDASGVEYDVAGLLKFMKEVRNYKTFVIQQRIESHSELSELSDTAALQTVRVVTHVDKAEPNPQILMAGLKIIVGASNMTDNFENGATGNLFADVNLRDGRIENVLGKHESGLGLTQFQAHPLTGKSFSEFRIPRWAAVQTFACEAALAFLPMQSIGWDIAVTPRGLVLIEGNMLWAAHNHHRKMGSYLALHRGH